MTTACEACKANIPDRTDDNYNSEHTKIQCEECGHWQWVPLEHGDSTGYLIGHNYIGTTYLGASQIANDAPRTKAIAYTFPFPWDYNMEMMVRHAEQLERELRIADYAVNFFRTAARRSRNAVIEDCIDTLDELASSPATAHWSNDEHDGVILAAEELRGMVDESDD